VVTDPFDGVGQIAQLTADAGRDQPPATIVAVGALVAGGQRALADDCVPSARGGRRSYRTRRATGRCPARCAPSGAPPCALVSLVGEVAAVGGDLARQRAAQPAHVVGAGAKVIFDRGPVRPHGSGVSVMVTSPSRDASPRRGRPGGVGWSTC
jgi:hypothetical protein